jgi:hypothetical protein
VKVTRFLHTSDMSIAFDSGDMLDSEWQDWYRLTPAERWAESMKLWEVYLSLGGSLDPEPDSQSPFNDDFVQRPIPPDGRPGVHLVRRGGV